MGCKVTAFQNASNRPGNPAPTIKITIDDPEWDQAMKNWLDGKNPTDSPEWKKCVLAVTQWSVKAFDFVKSFDHIPSSTERPCQLTSNSELRRWFTKKSIKINDKTPAVDDFIFFPLTELVFHPKSPNRITMW